MYIFDGKKLPIFEIQSYLTPWDTGTMLNSDAHYMYNLYIVHA